MIKENYSGETIDSLIPFFKLNVKRILHVGAHKCEEQDVYLKYTSNENIYWVEAIDYLVEENLKSKPELNLINECIGDVDGKEVTFKISNNTLSSSMLELGDMKPKVIIRVAVGSKVPFSAGPQHTQNHTEAMRKMLTEVEVIKGLS